ncbi:hypothetical protein LRP50_12560 [Enterovibrio sp. ZSDZ42]|uniref:SnoaL-like domain-containing protein n=1 Tax=Enterovibrio gelatinilyticus TaxID=2899819 RepID=A0ABT5R1D1_9GAMM|nr:hypothetical protein [Enterovibrio sp. ZSDZ42]MDD1793965.1 hypothetical protein [Enterovibrio sp. ZSDZ42]
MSNIDVVRELWAKFSRGEYVQAKALLHENLRVVWPTSREYYETRDEYIAVNEVFGADWKFEVLSLEETTTNKVISVTYVSSPHCDDSFYATSILSLENGIITNMDTYWAFQDKQPEWRKQLSKVY